MSLFPQLMSTLLVFALLGFIMWWLKKKGAIQIAAFLPPRLAARRSGAGERLLARVDALQLSATHSLSLIRLADRAILVGISPAGFYLLESSSWKSLQSGADQRKTEQEQ